MRRTILMAILFMASRVHAAVVAAPGYGVHAIPTPGTVQGGVVRQGDAILVGQGSFGGGTETIVRLDGGGSTTIATGFNSLGGFDLDASGTLYVVDNCGECMGATTGDTLYAIPSALTRTTSVTALGREVVAAGTIPFAFDVLLLADGTALVSDAAGNGAGRVVKVVSGTATDLITGLDLVGGIAQTGDGTLRIVDAVLNMDFSTTGKVLKYTTGGTSQGALISGLTGGSGAAIDADGNVLVTGVGSFGASKVIAVAPGGTATDRATGFTFAGDVFFDAARDEALVLDFGVSSIAAICRDRDGDGVCDVDDDCPSVADPGQEDADANGQGDACPCATIEAPSIAVGKLDAPSGDETLTVKGRMTIPTTPPLDPVANGMHVVVAGTAGTIVDAVIPGGAFDPATKTGWKKTKKGSFSYQNPAGIDGIVKIGVKVSTKTPGLVQLTVKGKNGAYAVAPSDLPLRATLALDAREAQCGNAAFPGAAACAFNKKGTAVHCK